MTAPTGKSLRNYRIETFFQDGSHTVTETRAQTDWRALGMLVYAAEDGAIDPDMVAISLLKQRDNGTWGRIARIVPGNGETIEALLSGYFGHYDTQCEFFGLDGEDVQCSKRSTKTFGGYGSPLSARPVCDEHYRILIDDAAQEAAKEAADPYKGSFCEAADNEGARIAAESHEEPDES